MRLRLQAIVLSLVALLVFGLGVPLALAVAGRVQQELFLDRLTDTSRFASVAQRPIVDARTDELDGQLRRYSEVYGVSIAVINKDRQLASFASSDGTPFGRLGPSITSSINTALAGRRPEPGAVLMPWDGSPLVLAEPILIDGEVRGAVVTVSDTGKARTLLVVYWTLIAAGAVLAFSLALLVALPVVRWILRPVRRLDEATESLVAAVVSGRDVELVGAASGPPELRKLGSSFDRMAASVGEALLAQRAFVADASHQLRNPLTALKLRLGNLDGHVDPAADEELEAAVADADRLNQILDGLLSMARAEASAGDLVLADLDTSIADRVADWRVVAKADRVGLETHGLGGGLEVLTPARGLEVVLDNLIDNALKFSEPGSVVEIGVEAVEDGVELSVRDHGPGLRPEELERATDRFWRSQSHQNVPGSGLGLAIVSEIATLADGRVRLELPDGGGLRVIVTLPVRASDRGST
ncbi:Signal transduction histidine kinase [Amycolatopsis xylanica]|uniref:histidine kinase n=1 Tax=Amycolatopsis xylanica TaxID=589385 RepID=A0A1H3Q3Z8_9PSEU|nr:HAMP domain-containing sensor histidine kinase [Amycolatopsis xylanica]SDZ08096.1 Signal transduction histidine kinase [Amycolatopsis xylanica]